jgi:predicted nucleotidyltransferase
MAMAYEDRELIRRIARYLAFVGQHVQVERAFLYGSYAYGIPRLHSDIDLVVLSPDFARMDQRRCQEQMAIWAWQAGVGDIEALGLTPGKFEAASDLSLLGEVRDKGIVVYDAAHPERTPAMALREQRAEYRPEENS